MEFSTTDGTTTLTGELSCLVYRSPEDTLSTGWMVAVGGLPGIYQNNKYYKGVTISSGNDFILVSDFQSKLYLSSDRLYLGWSEV